MNIALHNYHILKTLKNNEDQQFFETIYKKDNGKQLEDNILKVVEGFGDALLIIDKNCTQQKTWLDLEFKDWYENKTFNNIFTIEITNPYLYMVPFQVKKLFFKTDKRLNHFINIDSKL